MNGDEVLDELVVRLADVAALPLVRAEDLVVVERVVDHRETWKGHVLGLVQPHASSK